MSLTPKSENEPPEPSAPDVVDVIDRVAHIENVINQVIAVRYDWLGHYLFDSIAEVQEHATNWIWTYNHERPNMALGGITPKQKLAAAA